MRSGRGLTLSVIVVATLLAGACGDPPDKEIDQAQGEIETARAAGADQYAHEEFTAALEALKRAHEAVGQRDYRLALNHALDSRERARSAAKEATDHRANVRTDADRALTDASAALGEARVKLKAAENAHVAPKILADARSAIAAGEEAVQKARAAFSQGDYLTVSDTVAPATARMLVAARELDAARRHR
jgi:hypothetical protein